MSHACERHARERTNQPILISNNQPLYQTSNQPSHYPKIPTLILSNPFRLVPLLGDPNLLVQLSQYPILSSVWHPHQGVTPLNWTLTFLVSTSVYCSLGTLSKSGQTAGLLRHCGLSDTRTKYQDSQSGTKLSTTEEADNYLFISIYYLSFQTKPGN